MEATVIYNLICALSEVVVASVTLILWPRKFWVSHIFAMVFTLYVFMQYGTVLPGLIFELAVSSAKFLYSKKFFLIAPILLIIGLALYVIKVTSAIWELFDLATGMGTAVSLLTDSESLRMVRSNEKSKGKDKNREMNRDLLQIGGGIIMIALILIFGHGHGRIAISISVFPLYIVGNYYSLFPGSFLGKFLMSLERPSTPLGLGAIWFAAGTLIAFGTVNSTYILAIIVFVTTIGDSLATLFGSIIKSPKLPYNPRKSVAGFAAIFIFSSLFGMFLIGYLGLFIGLLSGVVESLSYYPLDDNFVLPVVLGAIGSII